jgi:hypothetical protein
MYINRRLVELSPSEDHSVSDKWPASCREFAIAQQILPRNQSARANLSNSVHDNVPLTHSPSASFSNTDTQPAVSFFLNDELLGACPDTCRAGILIAFRRAYPALPCFVRSLLAIFSFVVRSLSGRPCGAGATRA